MALGEHDNLDEPWPTGWADRFESSVAAIYATRPKGASDCRLISAVADRVGGTSGRRFLQSQLRAAFRVCESPIERALLATMLLEVTDGGFSCALWSPGLLNDPAPRCFIRCPELVCSRSARQRIADWPGCSGQARFILYPQLKLGRYRADVFVVFECCIHDAVTLRRTMVVECDGHDYHERTKKQASADKARDRYMQARGHMVFRFTGADIWHDPIKCAREALGALAKGGV